MRIVELGPYRHLIAVALRNVSLRRVTAARLIPSHGEGNESLRHLRESLLPSIHVGVHGGHERLAGLIQCGCESLERLLLAGKRLVCELRRLTEERLIAEFKGATKVVQMLVLGRFDLGYR